MSQFKGFAKKQFRGFPDKPFGNNRGFPQPARWYTADPRYLVLNSSNEVLEMIDRGYDQVNATPYINRPIFVPDDEYFGQSIYHSTGGINVDISGKSNYTVIALTRQYSNYMNPIRFDNHYIRHLRYSTWTYHYLYDLSNTIIGTGFIPLVSNNTYWGLIYALEVTASKLIQRYPTIKEIDVNLNSNNIAFTDTLMGRGHTREIMIFDNSLDNSQIINVMNFMTSQIP
ncbi:MAG: hypothetical protein PF448_13155 [Bacteroidales bacterium]|jgi:hypothetical protein|nr:hypothetical protein [Bacteroidales bacterium]